MTKASAGAASADASQSAAFAGHAAELLDSGEYGVRFTSDYEPGGDYPPAPPPPAEEQHAMGLHEGAEGGE